jgi:hypothetical protein
MQQSERIFSGWQFAQMEFKAEDYQTFTTKYSRESEASNSFYSVGHFLEICGVLMKYGLLNEDLFFDTFWFEPIWKNFEPVIKSMREEFHEPSLEENFELLYNRYVDWKKRNQSKIKPKN